MTTKHTPEPWKVQEHGWHETGIYPDNDDDPRIAMLQHGDDEEQSEEVGVANAHRIVACVNALAGIEDPQAWRAGLSRMADMEDHVRELVEAAKAAMPSLDMIVEANKATTLSVKDEVLDKNEAAKAWLLEVKAAMEKQAVKTRDGLAAAIRKFDPNWRGS